MGSFLFKNRQDLKENSLTESERLKKQLKPYGRQYLLEQALCILDSNDRAILHRVFAKFLLTSKSFYWTAKNRHIYHFVINIDSGYISFGFLSHTRNNFWGFKLTYEKAVRLIEFLQQNCTIISVYLEGNETSEFLQLIPLLEGRLELGFTKDSALASQIIKTNWSRLDILKCHSSALSQNAELKSLEELSVYGIETMHQLHNVLRHNVKELHLRFNAFDGDTEPIHNVGKIDTCFLRADALILLQLATKVVSSCPTLKQLNVDSQYEYKNAQLFSTNTVINGIVQRYNVYNQLIQFVGQRGIDSTVNIDFKYFGDNFKLPQNWMTSLFNRLDFSQINYKTEVVDNKVTTTLTNDQKDEKLNAKFCIELCYQYA